MIFYLLTFLEISLSVTIKCISKLLPKRELLPFFQNTVCRDFWQDYDNLNVAIDPNVS